VRMKFEKACALDPEGHEIASSVVDRVAEMESPSLSRGEAAVHMGGEKIGEWTPEVDLAVDRAVSFEVAHSFADQMNEIANDPESLEWKGIEADAKKAMAREWGGQITDQAEMDRQIARYMPTPRGFHGGEDTLMHPGRASSKVRGTRCGAQCRIRPLNRRNSAASELSLNGFSSGCRHCRVLTQMATP